MKGTHSQPARKRSGGKRKKATAADRGNTRLLWIGWSFLGVVLVLAVVVAVGMISGGSEPAEVVPTIAPGPAGSAFTGQGVQTLTTNEGGGGRTVTFSGSDCQYTEPGEITFGILESVDVTALADAVTANVGAAGWGEVLYSVTDNGSLLFRAANPTVLGGDDFEKQAAFLASDKPEAYARTFLENSGLISLLRGYGLTLSTAAENKNGEISFSGTSDAPGGECSLRLTFLYNGEFNQALFRAVYLAGAVTTDEVVPLSRAMKNAVTWTAGTGESPRLTGVELRHIRGIPFYVLDCSDGTAAYALAVEENALNAVPGAAELYRELLAGGIQDNIVIPGAE